VPSIDPLDARASAIEQRAAERTAKINAQRRQHTLLRNRIRRRKQRQDARAAHREERKRERRRAYKRRMRRLERVHRARRQTTQKRRTARALASMSPDMRAIYDCASNLLRRLIVEQHRDEIRPFATRRPPLPLWAS